MVQLNKPTDGPRIPYTDPKLAGKCKLEERTKKLKEAYEADPVSYDSGAKSFPFDGALWADDKIKKALKVDVQNNRCCFCEKDITDGGSLEHFRPKEGGRQEKGDPISKPGYYWLVYEWKNWFYACQQCNGAKGTIFPLADPTQREKSHLTDEDCAQESPLLLDLTSENPSDFIEYVGLEIVPKIKNDPRCEAIIDTVSLDRAGLFNKRVNHSEVYWRYRDAMLINKKLKKETIEENINFYNGWLEESSEPGQEFSYMMKCNLDAWKFKPLNDEIVTKQSFLHEVKIFLLKWIAIWFPWLFRKKDS